jgi:hypothetical protein
MKTPPLLLGAALLFWGAHTNHLILTAVMAVALEIAPVLPFKWELTLSDWNRIWLLCLLVSGGFTFYPFIGLALYWDPINIERVSEVIFKDLQPFPIICFPLMACQCYSTSGIADLRAFLLIPRKKKQLFILQGYPIPLNLAYPYVMLCCISFNKTIVERVARPVWFVPGVIVLVIWMLWSFRSRRYSPGVWISILAVIFLMRYVGQTQVLSRWDYFFTRHVSMLRWLRGLFAHSDDPYQSTTAIGDIGELKFSNHVVFRVRSEMGVHPKLLLREASYQRYQASSWSSSSQVHFVTIPPEADETTWNIQPEPTPNPSQEGRIWQRVTVSCYLQNKKAILKLPTGTFRIEHLLVGVMTKNPFGTIQVEEGPGLITYQTVSHPSGWRDGPPTERDLLIPEEELPAVQQIVDEFHLAATSPEDTLRRISTFFRDHFSYSLELERQVQEFTPLADFLLNTRSGHCEYFATATVLLLRAAGIPARYAVGYAVAELEEGQWLFVRGRDAHAWTLVYLNGAWHDFDTTPSSWRTLEQTSISPFERLSDLWYRWKFAFSEWRWRERKGGIPRYLGLVVIPLFLFLAWRIAKRLRLNRVAQKKEASSEHRHYPGVDSAFYVIERMLQKQEFVREPGEPLTHWIQDITNASPVVSFHALQPILILHYRYRFDPEGLTPAEKATLQSSVQAWVERYEAERSG